jgi:hypothetical protein
MIDIMNRRRLFVIAGMLMTCVVLTLGALAMLPPRPGVTKANFNRIKKGMTKPEVSAILGKSGFPAFGVGGGGGYRITETWSANDGAQASVGFEWVMGRDEVAKVCSMTWRESTETPLQRVCRWLKVPQKK